MAASQSKTAVTFSSRPTPQHSLPAAAASPTNLSQNCSQSSNPALLCQPRSRDALNPLSPSHRPHSLVTGWAPSPETPLSAPPRHSSSVLSLQRFTASSGSTSCSFCCSHRTCKHFLSEAWSPQIGHEGGPASPRRQLGRGDLFLYSPRSIRGTATAAIAYKWGFSSQGDLGVKVSPDPRAAERHENSIHLARLPPRSW